MTRSLYKVAAQGRFVSRLGRTSWPLDRALELAADLRRRGYADAHAQLSIPGLGPLALTLVVAIASLLVGCSSAWTNAGGLRDGGSDDAGEPAEASGADDAPDPHTGGDAASDAGTLTDGHVCTPFPQDSWAQESYCPSLGSPSIQIPAQFEWQSTTGTSCGNLATPVACTCEETYNCQCLQLWDACSNAGGLSWYGCNMTSRVPTVICR